jgi:DNA-binding IclR family transcriptional regulator
MSFNTLGKSLDIIDLLARMKGDLNVVQISQELAMPKSTAYKYLAILKNRGFLEYDGTAKTYSLGFKFLELASMIQSRFHLDKVALPHMKRLSLEINETVILAILKFHQAYCLDRIEGGGGIVFNVLRGSRLPLHCSAAAKVLLAFSDEDIDLLFRKETFKSYTPHTVTDLDLLKKQLQHIREAGYTYADQEMDIGARALAAPIFDDQHNLIGALDVVGPMQRLTEEKIAGLKERVIHYANMIGEEFSGHLRS